MHELRLEFSKQLSDRTFLTTFHFVSDKEGHYNMDGVSFSSQGVIVASDGAIVNKVTGDFLFLFQGSWR